MYKLQEKHYATDLFCFDLIMSADRAKQQYAHIVENLRDASMLVTSKNYYRRRPQKIRDAENAKLPVYVLRGNSPSQIRQLLGTLLPAKENQSSGNFNDAMIEAEEAVEQIKEGEGAIELSPQSSYIRRLQHLIAQRNDLDSHSFGKEPNRRVRIFKEQAT